MFRHPNLKHSNGTFDDLNFEKKIDQSIRYFKVPAMVQKEGALNMLLNRIEAAESKPRVQGKVIKMYFTIGSVAAAACIAFIVFYSFVMVETFTGGNHQASNVVYLPDQSRVVLADGAQIKFSKMFFQRNVKLKGEAYFEVEKGSNFYVATREGGVLVIGTRFSVNDMNNSLKVHCYEGVVGVNYFNQKIKIPEGVQFNGINQMVDVVENKDFGYPKYAIFNFSFTNIHLKELWPVVEKYFGIEIVDHEISKEAFTGSFHTGNVKEVIDIVCTSMKISYDVVNEDEVVIKK